MGKVSANSVDAIPSMGADNMSGVSSESLGYASVLGHVSRKAGYSLHSHCAAINAALQTK